MIQRIIVALRIGGVAFLAAGCSASGVSTPLPNSAATASGLTSLAVPGKDRVRIREFSDLPQYSDYYGPSAITSANGSLWVTDDIDQDFGENVVVQLTTSGKMTNAFYYSGPISEGASFRDIVQGSDGNFWIADSYNAQIVKMTPQGSFTNFPLPSYSFPDGIVSGPDKALWFAVQPGAGAAIGRLTVKGRFTLYPVTVTPQDIAVGSDGALWFTAPYNNAIGRVTTDGKFTEYTKGISTGADPYSIAPGPDGALWFTEALGGRIARITTHGKVTEYSKGITPTEEPADLTAGPDGAMWFTEFESYGSYQIRASKIGRIATNGKVHEYSRGINPKAEPTTITPGPDGNMWFVESSADETGRLSL